MEFWLVRVKKVKVTPRQALQATELANAPQQTHSPEVTVARGPVSENQRELAKRERSGVAAQA
jgi:hypothetical protein